ncbi:MAG: S24 family peptidase [Nitrospirota bacterium]|jgi:phage repressor protein C with HTH and peptisase S24 domain
MEIQFRDGDIIIVNPHIKPDHNDYIVLKNEEEEAVFKQMCRTSPNLLLTIHGLAGFSGRWSKK